MWTEKSEIVGSLEAGLNGTCVEVVVSQCDGQEVVALQLSTWNEALGWQVQKTLPLAADKLGQLQRLLSQARQRIEDRRLPAAALAQVIPLTTRGPAVQAASSVTQPARQLENLAS